MLWFFERAGKHLQCEIRPASDGTGFEVAWIQDGESRLERFDTPDEAEERRRVVEDVHAAAVRVLTDRTQPRVRDVPIEIDVAGVREMPLDHNLGGGRNLEGNRLAFDDIDGFAKIAPQIVRLIGELGQRQPAALQPPNHRSHRGDPRPRG